MKRREFTRLTIAGFLFTGTMSLFYSCGKKPADQNEWVPDELARIRGKDKLVSLGLKYRQQSGENNREGLIQIFENDKADRVAEGKNYMVHKIEEDFRNDRTILIDGWILSITEARLCALVSFEDQ